MTAVTHQPGYQARDREVVDYAEYLFGATGLRFRGPDPGPLPDGGFVSFLGAAQTFGCFTDRPFASQVGAALDVGVRNLGYGGAGPRFYLEHPALLEEANRGAAAVVQVMSARSEDNRLYRSGGLEYLERRRDGARVGANDAYAALVGGFDAVTGRPRHRVARAIMRRARRPLAVSVVRETRANWVASYESLLDRLTVPVVLLWLSTRAPDYRESYRSVNGLFGAFPQLVNAAMVDRLKTRVTAAVEVVSTSGLPQPLMSRVTGEPTTVDPADDRPDLGGARWTHNRYYPSPEMHDEAAEALSTVLRRILCA